MHRTQVRRTPSGLRARPGTCTSDAEIGRGHAAVEVALQLGLAGGLCAQPRNTVHTYRTNAVSDDLK
jgi:hypothetical protein